MNTRYIIIHVNIGRVLHTHVSPHTIHILIPPPPHPFISSHTLTSSPSHSLTSHSFLKSTRTCSTNTMPSRHSLKKTKRSVSRRSQRCARYRPWTTRQRHTWKKHSGSPSRRKMRRLASCRCRWVEQRAGAGGPPLSSKPESTTPFLLLKCSKVSLCSGLKAKCLLYLLKYFTG